MKNCEITTMIVDDESACIKSLSRDLDTFSEIQIVATCTSPEKAIREIIRLQPDLLFLDVEMPGMTGIELLSQIESDIHSNMHVVFYTAYDKYWLDAIRASAFDYLLKPYHLEELSVIISRLRTHLAGKEKVNIDQSLRKLLSHSNKYAIQTISDLMLIRHEEIFIFQYQKEQRYWQMMLTDGKLYKLRMSTTAKDLLGISPCLIQINQDCIINLNQLSSIGNGTLKCNFYPPFTEVEQIVSQRYYRRLKEMLEVI